jgi:hypothetical protein
MQRTTPTQSGTPSSPPGPPMPAPGRPGDTRLVDRLAAWLETRPGGNRNYNPVGLGACTTPAVRS